MKTLGFFALNIATSRSFYVEWILILCLISPCNLDCWVSKILILDQQWTLCCALVCDTNASFMLHGLVRKGMRTEQCFALVLVNSTLKTTFVAFNCFCVGWD